MRHHREKAVTKAASITVGLSVLRRAASRPPPSPRTLLAACSHVPAIHAPLRQDLNGGDLDFPRTKAAIKTTFASCPRVIPGKGKPNFLSSAKHTLPNQQRSLTHIVHGDDVVREAKPMADHLRAFWEPIWNKPNPPSSTINEYLASYPKRITSIPLRPTHARARSGDHCQIQGLLHGARWHPLPGLPPAQCWDLLRAGFSVSSHPLSP